jgi:hypothetical protein
MNAAAWCAIIAKKSVACDTDHAAVAVVGGYAARIGRRMNPRHIRVMVTIISVVITMASSAPVVTGNLIMATKVTTDPLAFSGIEEFPGDRKYIPPLPGEILTR